MTVKEQLTLEDSFRNLTAVAIKVKSDRDELLGALIELVSIAKEANIPMVNSHAVRKMGKFMKAMDRAKSAIDAAKESA